MSAEALAIISSAIVLGGALVGVLAPTLREIRREIVDLRERVTRLETLFESGGHSIQPQSWSAGVEGEPPPRQIGASSEDE